MQNIDFSKWGPLTVLIVILVTAAAVGGLVVCVVHPETLDFKQYLDDLKTLVLGLAGLAGAHALLGAGQSAVTAKSLDVFADPTDYRSHDGGETPVPAVENTVKITDPLQPPPGQIGQAYFGPIVALLVIVILVVVLVELVR